MWSGGYTVREVSTTDDAAAAYGDMANLQQQAADQQRAQRDAGQAQQDAQTNLGKARTEQNEEKGEREFFKSRARSADQGVQSASEQLRQNAHNIDNQWQQLMPDRERIRSMEIQRITQQWVYEREISRTFDEKRSALYQELQQHAGEVWRFFCAASSAIGHAIIADISGRLQASLTLNFANYYSPMNNIINGAIQTGILQQSEIRNLAGREQDIRTRTADQFYARELASKKGEQAEYGAKWNNYESVVAEKKSAEEAAEAAWRGAIASANAAQDTLSDTQSESNAIDSGLRVYNVKKGEEDARKREEEIRRAEAARAGRPA